MRIVQLFLTGLSILLALSFLHGCATTKSSYKEGMQYLDAQAYDQAVEKLAQAQSEKPTDPNIAADLERARQLAAEHHFQVGVTLSEQNEINGALINFGKAKEYQPQNTTYMKRYDQEKDKYDQLAVRIRKAVADAGAQKQWDRSLEVLTSMKNYESSFPEISRGTQQLKEEAASFYENRSEEKMAMQDYEGAYNEIEKALDYSRKERLKSKKKALHHILLSDQALKKKEYLEAYDEIQKGLEFEPNNPELKKYEKRLVDQWAEILYNDAIQASNDGRLLLAKARLTQLSKLKPGYLNVEELLSEFQSSLATDYYTRADALLTSEDRSWTGTALANYLLVREQHNTQFPDLEDKIAETKRRLKQEVELRIALDFKNKSEDPGAAGIVKDQILARLNNRNELKNVNILERETIDEMLREQGLGQGFLDESTSLQVKKIKGIHAGVVGEVRKVSVKESGRNRSTSGSSRYKSGTRLIPNPGYQTAQMNVSQAQQEVFNAQQQLNNAELENRQVQSRPIPKAQPGTAGMIGALAGALSRGTSSFAVGAARKRLNAAQNRLRNAQVYLGRTPQQVEEPVWADYTYKIYNLKLEGEVVISFRIVDYTTSEMIGKPHLIRKQEVKKDRYIPGDPAKGVPNDPNVLPTIEEFKTTLLVQAIDDTYNALKSELSGHSENYYDRGQTAENNGLGKDAVENYIRYIYSATNLADARVQHANDYIYEKMGLWVVRKRK
jgi:tetratricopeptide (TPR) repeat protein